MTDLAESLMHTGHYGEAEKVLRETLDIQHRVLGPDHADTAATTYALARIAVHKGESEKAVSLLRQALDHGLEQRTALGIENDPDLKSLHGVPRFEALVSDAHQRAAPAAKAK
jgi:hypothetical protein